MLDSVALDRTKSTPPSPPPEPEVVILHASDPIGGGVVSATLFYAAALIAAGHPAEIWTPSGLIEERAKRLNVPVFRHRAFMNAGMPIVHPQVVRKALRARRRVKAVIQQGEKHWLFGRMWMRGAVESVVFHNTKINQRRFFKHWLAISESHRRDLTAYAQARGLKRTISLIRNGPLPDASRSLSPRPIKPILRIGAISDFGEHKGMAFLVRAFAEIAADYPSVSLVLAGDGPRRQYCQHLAGDLGIGDRVEWPGWLRDTRAFFDGIDLFCLPSLTEPFGIVITEAMQAGLAVIATDTYGPRDIVSPGETGWIVPPGDSAALAAALRAAIADPVRTAAYGSAGLSRYQANYTLEAAGTILAEALGLPPVKNPQAGHIHQPV
jgi:glycosyltransferase involved in cell wall biosynthesis